MMNHSDRSQIVTGLILVAMLAIGLVILQMHCDAASAAEWPVLVAWPTIEHHEPAAPSTAAATPGGAAWPAPKPAAKSTCRGNNCPAAKRPSGASGAARSVRQAPAKRHLSTRLGRRIFQRGRR